MNIIKIDSIKKYPRTDQIIISNKDVSPSFLLYCDDISYINIGLFSSLSFIISSII